MNRLKSYLTVPASLLVLIFLSAFITKNLFGSNESTAGTPNFSDTTVHDTLYKTFLALGDSYTIGEWVKPFARFPAQTVALLKQSSLSVKEPVYIATTGFTTINLISAINSAKLKPPYDVVSLLIGVNDQYQTRDTTNYRGRFKLLLNKCIQLAGNRKARVFVLSIPDYSVTPFVQQAYKKQISQEIDLFNRINREVALQYNVSYTDITPSSREAASNRSLIAFDSLHFSGSEYMKWAEMLSPKIKAVL